MTNKILVKWNGRFPTACMGRWEISFNDKKMKIPSEISKNHMNTYKFFNYYPNGDDLNYYDYDDGLEYQEWVIQNSKWIYEMFENAGVLKEITLDDLKEMYTQIQKQDWRKLSCGGCT